MELTRIIHPIGQGGFYTETLSQGDQKVNIVYDCGGFGTNGLTSMNDYLKSYIEYINNNGQKIDAIFISHFHADHINGLQYLLDNITVDYLIIPQLTDDVIFEALIYNYSLATSESYFQIDQLNQFLVNLYLHNEDIFTNGNTKVIQITSRTQSLDLPEQSQNTQFEFVIQEEYRQNNNRIVPSGTIFHCCEWLFIPYNIEMNNNQIDTLKNKFTVKFGIDTSSSRFLRNLPKIVKQKGVDVCKEIYNEVFGTQHNGYSMTLFSGTIDLSLGDFSRHYLLYHKYIYLNILYTGDFEPDKSNKSINTSEYNKKIDALIYFYKPMWDIISFIQVPHHGSIHNYHDDLYKKKEVGFISVGNHNSYNHPSIETLCKMQHQHCTPIIVTEDKSSMRIYHYEL